jgi:hypothetical protein
VKPIVNAILTGLVAASGDVLTSTEPGGLHV